MKTQSKHALVASKPFTLICSYRVPTTEVNPDFIPSVSVVIGHYDSQEQAKQARQAIQHAALISAWCYHSFESNASDDLGGM
ncbi:MAG TPA: SPOR domain-containing protein [Agitococcus sp.]|nr:SPOR domain-containing protein [Agitococcus sp.]